MCPAHFRTVPPLATQASAAPAPVTTPAS
jgi:hypothetical protein